MSKKIKREYTDVSEKSWYTLWIISSLIGMGVFQDYSGGTFLQMGFLTVLGYFGSIVYIGILRVWVRVVFEILESIFPLSLNTFLKIPKLRKIVDDNLEYEMFVWQFRSAVIINILVLNYS